MAEQAIEDEARSIPQLVAGVPRYIFEIPRRQVLAAVTSFITPIPPPTARKFFTELFPQHLDDVLPDIRQELPGVE